METGRLFIFSGPSGVGKGVLVKELQRQCPNIKVSISCVTRSRRPNEIEGVHYFFLSEERFNEMIAKNEFLEHAYVHGKGHYGTPRPYVEKMLSEGYDVILEIDVQGCEKVLQQIPDAATVFILPPSRTELLRRLTGRNTETSEEVQIRIRNAEGELHKAERFQYLVVNNTIPEAVRQLRVIIEAEHLRGRTELLQPLYDEFKEANPQ